MYVGAVLAGIGALAWLSTAVHAVLLLSHRAEGVSLFTLAFSGYRFFQRDTFKPSGHAIHQRFLRSAAAFALTIVASFAVAMLLH